MSFFYKFTSVKVKRIIKALKKDDTIINFEYENIEDTMSMLTDEIKEKHVPHSDFGFFFRIDKIEGKYIFGTAVVKNDAGPTSDEVYFYDFEVVDIKSFVKHLYKKSAMKVSVDEEYEERLFKL
jgi:hypothetical protein